MPTDLAPYVLYEASLITVLECLERQAESGAAVYAQDITRLLARYGTSYPDLPHYLQDAVDRIDLID